MWGSAATSQTLCNLNLGLTMIVNPSLNFVLDFWYIASFRNRSASKATRKPSQNFAGSPVKFREGLGEMSQWIFQVDLRTRPLYIQGEPTKPDHFWKSVTPVYDDAERRSLYQIVQCFIWSKSAVLHLLQLNIHCTSMVKPCYSKNDYSPLFTVHTLRPFYVFSNVLDFIKAVCSIYQNVQYFIRSKKCV